MIKVAGMTTAETARAFDRAMKERRNDGHDFKPMNIGGMETICDKCYQAH
jgi:hypothetical protein